MRLVWKLLRQHISFSQLAGFFANLCGMVIVLLSVQFYKDVLPVFTEGDSFHEERLCDSKQESEHIVLLSVKARLFPNKTLLKSANSRLPKG